MPTKQIRVPIDLADWLKNPQNIEAVRQLKNNPPPDVIFLDYNMPGRSGEDCLLLLREMEHLKSIPIIIYSTGVNDKLKQRLIRKGAAMVIKKHGTTAELKSFFSSTFLSKTSDSRSAL